MDIDAYITEETNRWNDVLAARQLLDSLIAIGIEQDFRQFQNENLGFAVGDAMLPGHFMRLMQLVVRAEMKDK